MACIHADSAATLLEPIILWIDECLSESSTLPDTDAYKVTPFFCMKSSKILVTKDGQKGSDGLGNI